MKLETVELERFKSVEFAKLDDCNELNVLIGKNNAGKSTFLYALQTFFRILSDDPIAISSPIARQIDFHNRDTSAPSRICLTFGLNNLEREQLISDISESAPQLRNAAQAIGSDLLVDVCLTTSLDPTPLTYVSSVVLKDRFDGSKDKKLLQIDAAAAYEMAVLAAKGRSKKRDSEILENSAAIARLDEDDWERLKRDRSYFPRIFYRDSISSELLTDLESIVRSDTTLASFRQTLQSLASSFAEQSRTLLRYTLTENRVNSFSGDESQIPSYALKLLQYIGALKVLYMREQRAPVGKEEARQLLDLKVRRGASEKLKKIQDITSTLLGVEIDAFEPEKALKRGESSAEIDIDNFLVEVNGAGIREALRLVLDIELLKPDIILIEEPELHLHPGLESTMMQYLKRVSNDGQIFVTTHSTNFLDRAGIANLYLVTNNRNTQVTKLAFEQAESELPGELGIKMSSFFMYDSLVFVEGNSDENIIRAWAGVLGINLSKPNIGFIALGGSGNLRHYAAESTLGFLSNRRVQLHFVLDRDEKTDAEIEKIQKIMGNRATVHFLGKREIENYLLCPRVLVQFIAYKLNQTLNSRTKLPNEDEIKAALEGHVESLKDISIEKRAAKFLCAPVYAPRDLSHLGGAGSARVRLAMKEMRDQLETLNALTDAKIKSIEDEINRVWENQRFDIAPGDELLDLICKDFGVRFNKLKGDGTKIASLMACDEIDKEIVDLLQSLGEQQKA